MTSCCHGSYEWNKNVKGNKKSQSGNVINRLYWIESALSTQWSVSIESSGIIIIKKNKQTFETAPIDVWRHKWKTCWFLQDVLTGGRAESGNEHRTPLSTSRFSADHTLTEPWSVCYSGMEMRSRREFSSSPLTNHRLSKKKNRKKRKIYSFHRQRRIHRHTFTH